MLRVQLPYSGGHVRRPLFLIIYLSLAMAIAGCQEDNGSSRAAAQDAPIVAAERERTALGSLRQVLGQPAEEPTKGDDTVAVVGQPSGGTVDTREPTGTDGSDESGSGDGQEDTSVATTEPEPAPEESDKPPTLNWTAPLTRENGSPLYVGEISGYRIYYRLRHQEQFQEIFLKGGDSTSYTLDSLAPGAYEFTITTLDDDGRESRRSDAVEVDLI